MAIGNYYSSQGKIWSNILNSLRSADDPRIYDRGNLKEVIVAIFDDAKEVRESLLGNAIAIDPAKHCDRKYKGPQEYRVDKASLLEGTNGPGASLIARTSKL